MRPYIDINNLSYSKETLIYYSRTVIFTWFLVIIVFAIASIYFVIVDGSFLFSIFLIPLMFPAYQQFKLLQRIDEIQFRINSKGIQYRNETLVPWNNIENERVVMEGQTKARTAFFIYYIINENKIMRCSIEKLNVGIGDLEHTLIIHRNRYKRENNIV